MSAELLEAGIGQSIQIGENGSTVTVEIADVQDDPPTSRFGSAIPGRRCLVAEDEKGNPWRVSVIYEYDGIHDLRQSRLDVKRGFENTLTDDWAWQNVMAEVAVVETSD